MLIKAENSCLLIVDVQERLLGAIHEGPRLVANSVWLMQIAAILGIPMLLSEQYPKGLGPIVKELLAHAPEGAIMEKVHFSCAEAPNCMERIDASGRNQWILAGMEAHVCVLQTALGLLKAGKEVYVVQDCVSSRHPSDMELAIERMRAEGVRIVSREMVAFEWLYQAATDQFREISRRFLR